MTAALFVDSHVNAKSGRRQRLRFIVNLHIFSLFPPFYPPLSFPLFHYSVTCVFFALKAISNTTSTTVFDRLSGIDTGGYPKSTGGMFRYPGKSHTHVELALCDTYDSNKFKSEVSFS
jgi:hypothetical protein